MMEVLIAAQDSSTRWAERVGHAQRTCLTALYRLIGPRGAYALTRRVGERLYALLPELRERSEANLAAAGEALVPPDQRAALAKRAFLHRMWNLADLHLAPGYVNAPALDRIGGRLPAPLHDRLLAAQARGQPAILLTAYFGSIDLLPILLALSGVRAATLYRPHRNRGFDAYRRKVRAQAGGELIPVEEALSALPRVLEAGGTVALVADHGSRHGIDAEFLGQSVRVPRTVGVLAARHAADVAVAGLRRVGESFRFVFVVTDIIDHSEFAERPDAVEWITRRYLTALEGVIRSAPEQYLWVRQRK